jgi:hypothetical protein
VAGAQSRQWHQILYSEILWEDLPDENRINL